MAHLVQNRLRHMIFENLRRGIAVTVLGTDIRTHHNKDAGTVRVAEVACLFGEFCSFPISLSTSDALVWPIFFAEEETLTTIGRPCSLVSKVFLSTECRIGVPDGRNAVCGIFRFTDMLQKSLLWLLEEKHTTIASLKACKAVPWYHFLHMYFSLLSNMSWYTQYERHENRVFKKHDGWRSLFICILAHQVQRGVLDKIGSIDIRAAFYEKVQRLLLPPLGSVMEGGLLRVVSRVYGVSVVDPTPKINRSVCH